MHFFNPRTLAEKLRDGVLSERQKFAYLIAAIVLKIVIDVPEAFVAERPLNTILLLALFHLFISCIGLRACFATNERGDNRHFIERWLCLTLPLSMWTTVLPFCISIAISAFAIYTGIASQYYGLIMVILLSINMASLVLYFVLLNSFIRIAASGPTSDAKSPFAPIAAP